MGIGRVLRIQQRKFHRVKGVTGGSGAKKCSESASSSGPSREGGWTVWTEGGCWVTPAGAITWLCSNGAPFLKGEMIRIRFWFWKTKKRNESEEMQISRVSEDIDIVMLAKKALCLEHVEVEDILGQLNKHLQWVTEDQRLSQNKKGHSVLD